jgi:hypothetical protein
VLGLLGLQLAPSGWAAVTYSYDDGTAERAIGIDPGEDSLWFNRFAVAPGGEVITSISAAFGRPGVTVALNGLPIKVLLYEDIDGGSPWNAVLKRSVDGVVSNANTNTLNVFNIPPTEVHGTLLAAMLLRNRTTENKFIAALDQTAPTFSDASFYAFTVGDMDEDEPRQRASRSVRNDREPRLRRQLADPRQRNSGAGARRRGAGSGACSRRMPPAGTAASAVSPAPTRLHVTPASLSCAARRL